MVNLDQLYQVAVEAEEVRAFVRDVTRFKITRGVTVRPLPMWKLLHHASAANGSLRWLRFLRPPSFALSRRQWIVDLLDRIDFHLTDSAEREGNLPGADLTVPPPGWARYSSNRDIIRRVPLLLTVMIQRGGGDDDYELLREIVESSPIPAIIEHNHDAELQLAAGDGIVAGSATGTLGGLLHDPNNQQVLGVTCSHVAGLHAAVTDAAGSRIGTCVATTPLGMNSNRLACDPLNSNAAPINFLDVSLIDIAAGAVASGTKPATSITHGQFLNVRRSGMPLRGFNIRSLAISFQLVRRRPGAPPDRFCFDRLVELVPRHAATQGSDSGAWAYTRGGDWAAMVIGGDGQSSFVIRSDHVLDWARQHAFSPARPSLAVY